MGLGNYEQNLIKSIAENDIREANYSKKQRICDQI